MPHYALFPVVSVLAQRAVGHGIAIEQHKGKFERCVRLDGGRLLGVGQCGVGGHLLIEIPDGHRLGLGAAEVVELEVILLFAFRLELVSEGGDVSLCGLGAADVVLDAGQEEGCDGQGDGAGVLLVEIVEGREETVGVSLLIHVVLQHQRIATENAVVEIILVGALTAAVGESLHHVEVQQPRAQIVAVVHVILNGLRGGAVDIEAVAGCKAYGTDECRTVDGEHHVGIVDRTDDVIAQVVQSAVIVDDVARLVVVVDRVDGQVATVGVVEQTFAITLDFANMTV